MGTYVVLGIALPYADCVRTVKVPTFDHQHPLEWEYDPIDGRVLWESYPALVDALGGAPGEDGRPRKLQIRDQVGNSGVAFFHDGERLNAIFGKEIAHFGPRTQNGAEGCALEQLQAELDALRPAFQAIAGAAGTEIADDKIGLWFVTL